MGGPWRERGFDPARLRSPGPRREGMAQVVERPSARDGLTKVVLGYIAGLVMAFGLLLGLMRHGW